MTSFQVGFICTLLAVSGISYAQTNRRAGQSRLGSADQQFITEAARANMAEIEIGQLAEERASSQDVKNFAREMVQDHRKPIDKLQQLASSYGVSLPASISSEDADLRSRLASLSGSDFDKQFVESMLKGHKEAIAKFDDEAARGSDPSVKSYAAETLPVLQNHMRMAEDLAGKLGVSPSPSLNPGGAVTR